MSEINEVWSRIVACAGETFHQVSGNPFTYRIDGNGIIPDRTPRRVPRSQFEKALALWPVKSTSDLQHLQGPSYLYAVLTDPRITSGGTQVPSSGAANPVPSPRTPTSPRSPQPVTSTDCPAASLSVQGYPFVLVGPLKPECAPSGAIQQFLPQSSYANAGLQALNAYGKGPFCRFRIPASYANRGVYALVVDNQVMYAGKCQNLAQRYNLGYGQISPKNCYIGGQSTNCKINHLVLNTVSSGGSIQLWFHETDDETAVEGQLITALTPPWNGALIL